MPGEEGKEPAPGTNVWKSLSILSIRATKPARLSSLEPSPSWGIREMESLVVASRMLPRSFLLAHSQWPPLCLGMSYSNPPFEIH